MNTAAYNPFADEESDGIKVDDYGYLVYDWGPDDDDRFSPYPATWDELEAEEREAREREIKESWEAHHRPRSHHDDPLGRWENYPDVLYRHYQLEEEDDDPARQYEQYCRLSEPDHTAVNPRAVAAWRRHLRRGRARTSPHADAAWRAVSAA